MEEEIFATKMASASALTIPLHITGKMLGDFGKIDTGLRVQKEGSIAQQ